MANKEEAVVMDDHENEDEIEEEQQILKCFEKDIDVFLEKVKFLTDKRSANPATQIQDNAEFLGQEDLKTNNPVVSDTQEKIAKEMFETKIRKNTPEKFWGKFKFFDFYMIVPYFVSLG